MLKSSIVKSILAGTTLVGGIAIGSLAFTGEVNLDNVKSMYDKLHNNYNIALSNLGIYKNEVGRLQDLVQGSKDKQQALQNKIDKLTQQLEQAQGGTEEDKQLIANLQAQIQELQAQLDEGATEEDLEGLLAEIERLQGELDKANIKCAELETYIAQKDADVTDITPVTKEEVENGVDISDLYYTFEGCTDTINRYFNELQIVDELNESPVIISERNGTITMGNARAFKKLYNAQGGNFAADFQAKYDSFQNTPNMTPFDKGYNALIQLQCKVTIDGTSYNVYWNTSVKVSTDIPNSVDMWVNENGSLKF